MMKQTMIFLTSSCFATPPPVFSPPLRNVIMFCTRRLAHGVHIWRWFALIYMIGMFLLVPIFFLGLSNLYTKDTTSSLVTAISLTIAFVGGLAWLTYWCKARGGDVKYVRFVKAIKKRTSKNKKTLARKDNDKSAAMSMSSNGDREAQKPTAQSLATLHHPSLEEKQQLHLQQLTVRESPEWLSVTTHKDQQGSEVFRLEL
jgi:hypothetical protein